jgi:serine/threonine protein kinase
MHGKELKRLGAEVKATKQRLDLEKNIHLRDLRMVRDEDRKFFALRVPNPPGVISYSCTESRFNKNPVLHNRYLLQRLLGRGGFSEVWRAFDLNELREVAVKIHQLNPSWSDEKKQSYTRHATREYAIHKVGSFPCASGPFCSHVVVFRSLCNTHEWFSSSTCLKLTKTRSPRSWIIAMVLIWNAD